MEKKRLLNRASLISNNLKRKMQIKKIREENHESSFIDLWSESSDYRSYITLNKNFHEHDVVDLVRKRSSMIMNEKHIPDSTKEQYRNRLKEEFVNTCNPFTNPQGTFSLLIFRL